ncbi:MAG TPA: PDZ domain-containing protein [Gemmatimonadota bacterium]
MFILVALALLAATPLAAQETPVRYTVEVRDPASRLFHVTAEFPSAGDELLVSLPAWSPGSYDIENYARNVREFGASGRGDRALDWDKADPDTWRIRGGGGGPVRVSFAYHADSLDLDKSRIEDDFAFFNGTNLFLYEEGKLDRPAELTLTLPGGWSGVATGLSSSGATNVYRAATYHELVDAPTFLGNFQLDSFTAGGKPARLAVYPAAAFTPDQRARIRESVDRILATQNAIVGDAPYDTYTVLLYVGEWATGFAGGLEHANSHFDILTPPFTQAFDQAFPILESLLAHETFHLWNVKRIRPAALWPYDYDEWQPTELLWFSEGVTDYYADLTNVRAGLVDEEGFFGQIENNLATLAAEPEPVALEDASLTTWLDPTGGNPYIYYPKGSLTGLLLDIRIRHATRNERSLDTVVRRLYDEFYERGRGFTTADLLRLLGEAGAPEAAAFHERYVDGREPLPLGETLAMAGLRLEQATVREPFLGVAGGVQDGEVVVSAISPGSPAEEAGVQEGDVLLSVGGLALTDPAWGDRFRETFSDRVGDPLEIRVRRGEEELALRGRVAIRTSDEYEVTRDPAAGELENAIFRSLVSGDDGRD